MDALNRTWNQFLKLFFSLTPSQRITYTVIPLLVIGAFGFLIFRGNSSSYVALSWGKVFTTDELAVAQQTLINAGLDDFHTAGQRIMVPAADANRYLATVMTEGGLSTNWGSELSKQFANEGMFVSNRQADQKLRIALANELSRVIQAIPTIDQASVTWARSEPRGWPRRGPRVTATINVKPRGGQPLQIQLVHSMQMAVANMIPDLDSSDVTVFDIHNGKTFKADDENNPYGGQLLARIEQFSRHHKSKLMEALSYIPGVLVTVNVDLDNLKSSIERNQKIDPQVVELATTNSTQTTNSSQASPKTEPGRGPNLPASLTSTTQPEKKSSNEVSASTTKNAASFTVTEKILTAAMPKAVQVSVQIPEDYYHGVLAKQGVERGEDDAQKTIYEAALKTTQTTVEQNIQQTVTNSIPAGADPQAPPAVNVSSYVQIDQKQQEINTPLMESVSQMISNWGSSVALGLFAIWALWMLKKSAPPAPAKELVSPEMLLQTQTVTQEEEEEEEEMFVLPESTGRERLQNIVRDNPEMTASVLEKWIHGSL